MRLVLGIVVCRRRWFCGGVGLSIRECPLGSPPPFFVPCSGREPAACASVLFRVFNAWLLAAVEVATRLG